MRVLGEVADLPLPVRLATAGAVVLGAVGCLTGLVVGMAVWPATAWAAAVEVGLPSVVVGSVLGLTAGAVPWVRARAREGLPPSRT